MFTKKTTNEIVGLDIEPTSAAAVQVTTNGSSSVTGGIAVPLADGAFRDGEVGDPKLLGDSLREAFTQGNLSKDVRIGIANQRVAFRIIRLPVIENPDEMRRAVHFRAQDELSMPLDSAVLDYQVIGGAQTEGEAPQIDVAIVAARREMISALLSATRHAGLRPAGIDLSAFGMIRALAGIDGHVESGVAGDGSDFIPATLYCNLGEVANLVVAKRRACLFARVSQFGLENISRSLAQANGLTDEHARQWMGHVGLAEPVETIEGEPVIIAATRDALERGVAKLADELRLSLDYYGAQEGAIPVREIVLSGSGSGIPGLRAALEAQLGREVSDPRPPGLAQFGDVDAARLTVAYGLALEN